MPRKEAVNPDMDITKSNEAKNRNDVVNLKDLLKDNVAISKKK